MRIIVKNERLSCHFRPMTKILMSGSHFFVCLCGETWGRDNTSPNEIFASVDDLCLLTTFHSHFLLDH